MSLRDRCKAFYQKFYQNVILRQGDPVQDLMEFVLSEHGRSADPALEDARPLVLYFSTDLEREEFIELWRSSRPGAVIKRVP